MFSPGAPGGCVRLNVINSKTVNLAFRLLRPLTSILLFLLCVTACPVIFSQVLPDSAEKKQRPLIAGFPIVFYTPETRWGFGATGTCIFNWRNDSLRARPSSVSIGLAFTQNRQAFFTAPFHFFIDSARYQVYGELAYNRYLYNFYGRGNEMPADYVERYGLEFPRARITALKRFGKSLYAGGRYAYDRFSLFDLMPYGLLANGLVPGAAGGAVSGPGAVVMFDSRDNIFYPLKGEWAELVFFRNMPVLGGTGDFTRIAFDAAKYITWKTRNTFAVNLYSIFSPGELPFYQMGMLGGIKKMRGFYEGRFRDNNVVLFQLEYRRWLGSVFGVAAFASAGQVARAYDRFHHSYWRYTYGAGIRVRVDPVRKLNLRIDAAVGNGKILPYFTVGEAF